MTKRMKSYSVAASVAPKASTSVEVVRGRTAKMDAFARHVATSPRFSFEAAAQAVAEAVARAKSHA